MINLKLLDLIITVNKFKTICQKSSKIVTDDEDLST